ncbi:hypothetical protein SLS55_005439 [Diplodia seriata]|uniref:Conidiation-specific protein 6 n=1 Tax=Diplodia seriata TaxID=420778 RepID=A0ABR3CGF3_9PEZI
MSNPGNVIGGHKANINNPNTSDEAKQHSRQIIDEKTESEDVPQAADQDKNPGNVAGGLKATVNNPNVSDEAKQSAKERLNEY